MYFYVQLIEFSVQQWFWLFTIKYFHFFYLQGAEIVVFKKVFFLSYPFTLVDQYHHLSDMVYYHWNLNIHRVLIKNYHQLCNYYLVETCYDKNY